MADHFALTRGRRRALPVLAALVTLALTALVGVSPALASKGSGGGGGTAPPPAPDFRLAANTSTGFVVRGGLQSCDGSCTGGLVEPKYQSCLADFTCTTPIYETNTLQVQSVNGFLGAVTLEVLGLPAGATSQMPASVTIDGSVGIPPFASAVYSLKAAADTAPATYPVTIRATSGTIVHSITLPIEVVDALPPLPAGVVLGNLSTVGVDSQYVFGGTSNVVAGTSTTGRVSLDGGAPAGGATVSLSSSNPAAASVTPASVTIPEGALSAPFSVTAANLTTATQVSISASYAGVTRSTLLTVWPPDTVAISRADYVASKRQLQVDASTSDTTGTSTLKVYTASTGELVGTLTGSGTGRYQGQLSWPANPQSITVRSDKGGSATRAVALK